MSYIYCFTKKRKGSRRRQHRSLTILPPVASVLQSNSVRLACSLLLRLQGLLRIRNVASEPIRHISALPALTANVKIGSGKCKYAYLHGLIFLSNISSSSAGVRLLVSGMMKNAAIHIGADTPAKKKQVFRPQLA